MLYPTIAFDLLNAIITIGYPITELTLDSSAIVSLQDLQHRAYPPNSLRQIFKNLRIFCYTEMERCGPQSEAHALSAIKQILDVATQLQCVLIIPCSASGRRPTIDNLSSALLSEIRSSQLRKLYLSDVQFESFDKLLHVLNRYRNTLETLPLDRLLIGSVEDKWDDLLHCLLEMPRLEMLDLSGWICRDKNNDFYFAHIVDLENPEMATKPFTSRP